MLPGRGSSRPGSLPELARPFGLTGGAGRSYVISMTTTTAKMTATEKAEYGTLSTAQRRKYSLVKRANGWSHKDALEFAKRVA